MSLQALLRALTTEVLRHGAIKTTKQKAKAVRPWVDKIILLAKAGGDAKMSQASGGPNCHRPPSTHSRPYMVALPSIVLADRSLMALPACFPLRRRSRGCTTTTL